MRISGPIAPVRKNGIGLMELLVAVALLAIGFLASAKMQVESMRANHLAYEKAQALIVLGDMMDRMRSNPEGVQAGLYDDVATGSRTEPACVTSGCTPTQLAELDLFEWSSNLQSLRGESGFIPVLPPDASGNPAVGNISAPSNGVYTLSLTWKRRDGSDVVDESVSLQFIP